MINTNNSSNVANMVKKFKDLLKKFCTETSILGLKYLYLYPDRVSRCFWIINIVAVLSLACTLTLLLWNRFRDMPTRITIEDQYSPVAELPYPAITLCSPNQMTLPNIRHFQRTLVDGNMSLNFMEILPQLMGFYEQVPLIKQDTLDHLQELIDLNRHNIREVMASLPQSCDQFLVHCIYEMRVVKCTNVFKPVLTMYGLCCISNSPYRFLNNRIIQDDHFTPIKPTKFGRNNAITVVTDTKSDTALDGTLLHAGSVKVLFNDWTEYPSNDVSTFVLQNAESFHSVEGVMTYCSEEVKALPIESRKCVFENEFPLQYFRDYHNTDCNTECFIQEVWRRCHCLFYYIPLSKISLNCNVTKIGCIRETRANLTVPGSGTEKCKCPRDCFSRRYKVHMYPGNLRGHQHNLFGWLYKNVTITNTTTVLHMYFSNPFYTQQKQETVMSLINLTSNLGGVFGMCLGCSAISVLEILFFVRKALVNARKRILQKRKQHRMANQH